MHITSAKMAFAALALLGSVQAHTRFTTLFVDGQNQGDGVCVRMDMNAQKTNSPIAGIQSPEMACGKRGLSKLCYQDTNSWLGRNGETGVARVCPAKGGSTLTFEFREWVDGSRPGAINPQHEGPCAVYLKKVDHAIASNNAAGDGWFKIWDESFDEAAGKWCINKMIANNGHLSVTIPSDIEGGYYLVRPELLALHAAQDSPPDPQFYVGCAQIYLDSTGSAKPATVTIPENYVDISMPGMTFNIYKKPLALPYPMYGPPAYKAGGSRAKRANPSESPAETDDTAEDDSSDEGSGDEGGDAEGDATNDYAAESTSDTAASSPALLSESPVAPTSASTPGPSAASIPIKNERSSSSSSSGSGQTEGLKPEGCIMVNANWCGFEVKSYTDENGCWSSSADCWKQSRACFDQAPPTGAKNCDLWNDKCNHLDSTCNAKQFTGPPDAGKDLTPTPPNLAARKLMALVKKHESHVMRRVHRARH